MGTDEGSFVPSATYHLTGDGDDLDRFDPDTVAGKLPQPERRVTRVLNGVIGDAWAKIEERHPDVVVSLSGAQQKGRELAAVQGDRAANVAAALIFSDEAHAIYDPLAPPRKEAASFMEDISVLGPDL